MTLRYEEKQRGGNSETWQNLLTANTRCMRAIYNSLIRLWCYVLRDVGLDACVFIQLQIPNEPCASAIAGSELSLGLLYLLWCYQQKKIEFYFNYVCFFERIFNIALSFSWMKLKEKRKTLSGSRFLHLFTLTLVRTFFFFKKYLRGDVKNSRQNKTDSDVLIKQRVSSANN